MITEKVVGFSSYASALPALGRVLGFWVLWILLAHLMSPFNLGKFSMGLAIALPLFLGTDWPRGNRSVPKGLLWVKGYTWALTLALTFLGVWGFGGSWETALILVLAISIVASLSFGRMLWQGRRQGFSQEASPGAWSVLKSLKPYGPVRALGALILLIPLYLLGSSYGFESVGIVAPLSFWIFLGPWFLETAHSQWGQTWRETLKNEGVEPFCHQFFKTLGIYAAVATGVFMLLLVGGGGLIVGMFGVAYAKFTDVFLWLSLGGILFGASALFCLGLTAAGQVADKVSTLGFWALLQFILSFLMVPNMGVGGVAWALCLIALLMVASQVITLEHRLRRQTVVP